MAETSANATRQGQGLTQDCEFCREISELGKKSQPPKLTDRGKIVLGVSGAVFTGISALLIPFVFPGFRKFPLPFLPASNHQVKNVMRALKGRSGSLIDIGSGDGRITDLSSYQNVVIFGVESMMPALEKKLEAEMAQNSHIVACRFPLPSWEPTLHLGEGIDSVWLYTIPVRHIDR